MQIPSTLQGESLKRLLQGAAAGAGSETTASGPLSSSAIARRSSPEVNDPIIVVYGAETPLRSRDITRLFFCLEEPSVGQSRCRFDAQMPPIEHATRRYVTDAVIWLPRLSGRRSYDD